MAKNNAENTFKSQQSISFTGFLLELPNLLALSILAVWSGSLMLALDALESLSNSTQSFLSFSLSKKLRSDDRFKYDYGMGKIEAFGAFASAMLLFIGLAVVFTVSVLSFINPSKPEEALLIAIIVKIFNVSIDVWLLRKQLKTVKGAQSSFTESNVTLFKKSLIFDVATLFTITTSFVFRDVSFIVYLDPVMCVVCAIYIGSLSIKTVKESACDLLDKTLDEKTQLQLVGCVSKIWDDIDGFHGVRTRRSGHIIYVDLMVSFDGNKPYAEIFKAYKTLDRAVKEILPDSETAIVIGEAGSG